MSAGLPCDGALIDPADDRLDLLVAQRHVVLEVLNADAAVDVPRRHLPRLDALLDGPRPGARFLVGAQRHRRDRAGLVTGLALCLEDWRDVLRERHLLRNLGRAGQPGSQKDNAKRQGPRGYLHTHERLLVTTHATGDGDTAPPSELMGAAMRTRSGESYDRIWPPCHRFGRVASLARRTRADLKADPIAAAEAHPRTS